MDVPASSAARPRSSAIDGIVPGFEIIDRIGEGGSSTVFHARQLTPSREVALKVLRSVGRHDQARFEAECKTVSRLVHPNIVRLHGSGIHSGVPWIAFEFVDGSDLETRIRNRDLTRAEIIRYIEDVCMAVHYAHQRGVLHRDLKPANIIVDRTGRACVVDFGVSLDVENHAILTRTGETIGTLSYMSPEQVRGSAGEISCASDVYGIGAILYQGLTGFWPFRGDQAFEVMQRILYEDPPRPRSLDQSISPDLESIVLKCLAKVPAERYASLAELAADLARYRTHHPVLARPAPRWRRAVLAIRRRPITTAVVCALALLITNWFGTWIAIASEREIRAASESRSRRDRSFAELLSGLSEFRHFEIWPSLSEFEFGDGRERVEKQLELARVLRSQRLHSCSSFFAHRARIDAESGDDPSLLERAMELEVLALADRGSFREAQSVATRGSSVGLRTLADLLAGLKSGIQEIVPGEFVEAGQRLSSIETGDVDGDGVEELLLTTRCVKNPPEDEADRVALYSFARGFECRVLQLPPTRNIQRHRLLDLDGDGVCEILRQRTVAEDRTVLEAYSLPGREVVVDRMVFQDTFQSSSPHIVFAAELDGRPGNELVVFGSPYRRTACWYTVTNGERWPSVETRRDLDPRLESSCSDVKAACLVSKTTQRDFPVLLIGTAGHGLFDIRSYAIRNDSIELLDTSSRGRVMGLIALSEDQAIYGVSTTRLDPWLPQDSSRTESRSGMFSSLRVRNDGRLELSGDFTVTTASVTRNFAKESCEVEGLFAWQLQEREQPTFAAQLVGSAACSRFDRLPASNLVLLSTSRGQSFAIASPCIGSISDIDGDGTAELAFLVADRFFVAGIEQSIAKSYDEWPISAANHTIRRWSDLLRFDAARFGAESGVDRFGGPWAKGIENAIVDEVEHARLIHRSEVSFQGDPRAVPVECAPRGVVDSALELECTEEPRVTESISIPLTEQSVPIAFVAEFSIPEIQYGNSAFVGLFDESGHSLGLRFSHERVPTQSPGSRHVMRIDADLESIVAHQMPADRCFEEDLWYRLTIRGRASSGLCVMELRAIDHPLDEDPYLRSVIESPSIDWANAKAGIISWKDDPESGGRSRVVLQRLSFSEYESR